MVQKHANYTSGNMIGCSTIPEQGILIRSAVNLERQAHVIDPINRPLDAQHSLIPIGALISLRITAKHRRDIKP